MQRDLDRWLEAAPTLKADSADLVRTYRRSLVDLAALRFSPLSASGRSLPAAGLPWFMTMFGRDSVFTSLQALPFNSELAATTLRELGLRQGTRIDDFRDEDPGRILHEMRYGEMTAFGERPHSPYYGNADATPLFVVLLDEYERWTGDTKLVRELEYEARAALNWIDEYANLRGDGYIWYQRRNEKTGLENQCWKDSWDSISSRDGTIPGFPRATCELQGYAYDAKMRAARLARTVWKDVAFADDLEKQAADLKRRFNRDFWVADDEYFALALDENGEQVDALASNNGHLLWSGIVDKSKAKAVVRHLMGPRLLLRLGSTHARRAVKAGTTRSVITSAPCGRSTTRSSRGDCAATASRKRPREIASGILDAAAFFDGRLPEAFGGYPRNATKYPVQYPTACSPQAWSTGTPLLLLRTMLGLEPTGDHLIVDPLLPEGHGSDRAARHPRPLGPHRRLRPRTLNRFHRARLRPMLVCHPHAGLAMLPGSDVATLNWTTGDAFFGHTSPIGGPGCYVPVAGANLPATTTVPFAELETPGPHPYSVSRIDDFTAFGMEIKGSMTLSMTILRVRRRRHSVHRHRAGIGG